MEVVSHNPITSMALISLDNLDDLQTILPDILKLKPSICDMINRAAIELVLQINPNQLTDVLDRPQAAIHLFIEMDDIKEGDQKKALKKLRKLAQKANAGFHATREPDEIERYWKVRHSISTILTRPHGQQKAVPVAEDVCVPINSLVEYLKISAKIYQQNGLPTAAWGHAGDGVVRMQPMLDLGQVGDRQKMFKVSEAIYSAVKKLEGSISAAAGDGRIRAPYVPIVHSPEYFKLIQKVKIIFDPYNIINPGVKTASAEEVRALMRGEYDLAHHHEHLPRS
jgi:FAD/FMN-containing dehydrogenase